MIFKILTSGRLGKEFEEYVSEFRDISCTYLAEPDEVKERIKEFNILAGLNFYQDLNISHTCWIHTFSAGVESVINHKFLNNKTIITRTVGNMGVKMGEYCLSYVLHIYKNISSAAENQKNKTWDQLMAENIFRKNILIFGTGGIGSGIAQVFHPLAQSVTGVNRSGRAAENFDEIIQWDELDKKNLSYYDVIINALPLTKETEKVFNEDILRRFADCIFINVGRGASVVEEGLLKALEEGYIKKAVLDVFEEEPLAENSILWRHPRILITPHHSALTDIEDVKMSFEKVFGAVKKGERNNLFVDHQRSY